MRRLAPVLLVALATAASGGFADAQSRPETARPEYAWCAAVSRTDNAVYYSEVFDVLGLERDVSGQWYGLMQHHYAKADLASARCFVLGPETSAEAARADRDRYVEDLRGAASASPSKVDTRWAIERYD